MSNFNRIACLLVFCFSRLIISLEAQEPNSDSLKIFEYKKFLEHEIVTAYGTDVENRFSTYAASTVKAEDIRSMNTTSLSNSLAGKLTGLNVSERGGAPGSFRNAGLRIRGNQTFLSGAQNIKVVVDGFETGWNNLLPDEIESITVLKDAASLAMYGITGANGVIYIKTKTGQKRDKALLTFNSRVSLQHPSVMPKFVSNGDYAEMYNIAMASDGKDIANGYFSSNEIVDYFKDGTYPDLYPDVDWYGELFKPSTITQDYTLSVNGGTDIATYNVLLGYSHSPGLYDGTDGFNNSNWVYDQYNVRINLDARINSWLRSEVKTRAVMSTTKQPNIDNPGTNSSIFSTMAGFVPYGVRTPNGNWGGKENYPLNPVGQVLQKGYILVNERTVDTDVKLIADLPVEGLNLFAQVVFSNNFYSFYNKTRGFSYEEIYPDLLNPGEIDSTIIKGNTDENFTYDQSPGTQWNRVSFVGGLEYNRTLNNGKLFASANYLQEVYTTTLSASNVPMAMINIMGRVNYMHKEKYVAEFGYSYSGTDNYGPGSRFGFFPSFSAAWLLSSEEFMKSSELVNLLKLRVSSGMVGNNQIGDLPRFMFLEPYGSVLGGYPIGIGLENSMATIENIRMANPGATWEKGHKTNIGVDAKLFDKISLSADYFFEKRRDIFIDPENNLSVLIGGRYTYLNLGSAKNSGTEIELLFNDNIGDLSFYLLSRSSFVKTEIIDSKEPPRAEDYLFRSGNPIGQPFVLEAIGFFDDQDDIENSPVQSFGTVQPGDVKYKDQNNDGVIDDNDVKSFGNPGFPRFIYSLDFGLEYKGFDFSVFLQGVSGRTISITSNNEIVPFLNNRKPTQWVMDNYWTPERGDDAKFPRLTTESNSNNYRGSTLWQRDGSFLRVKNIELGYSLSTSFSKKLGIECLRVYMNAVNSLTFSQISDIDVDPEINNPFVYPMMKSYNLGVTLNF